MTPFLSVLIPCRNEALFLSRCLDSILGGDFAAARMEVLVIDGGSTDGTRAIIADYRRRDSRVRLIENPEAITPWALNHGIEAARGEIIARVDAHARVAQDYFSKCVAHLLSSGADNVGGVMRTIAQHDGLFAGSIVTALSHPFGVGNSHFRIGSEGPRWVETVFGGCWRREVFARIGRFNTALQRSQDMEFSLRLKASGGKTLLAPDIRCDYYARASFGEFWRHNFRNGEWAVLPFVYSSTMPVSLRHLIPLFFLTALLAGGIGYLWTPWLFAGVAVPYTAANLIASLHAAFKGYRACTGGSPNASDESARASRAGALLLPRVFLPLIFLSLHLAYGLGSMAGCIKALAILGSRRRARPKESSCLQQH